MRIVGDEPVFETGLLFAGDEDPANVRRQLSRWTEAGQLYQLRRGLYALAPPYQKTKPHPFLVANRMVKASYVSCQSALAHFGLIPDHVPVAVSVTTLRPCAWETPLGAFEFHHLKPTLLFGYRFTELGGGQQAFVATPEKALMDLVHFQPEGDSQAYLDALRLQNLDRLDIDELQRLAQRAGSAKLCRAATRAAALALSETLEYRTL